MSQIEICESNPPLTCSERLSLAGLLFATLLTFSSTFTFGWVYDDVPQIPQNQNLQWGKLWYLFTHSLWASLPGSEARFYRPLLSLWFLLNKTLFGLHPHWFHVTSVLAHVAATALAFVIARQLLRNVEASLFTAAIFGIHPLQVESASWISSVNDPLATLFCFGSFLAYRKARMNQRKTGAWWAVSAILFLLALLTKEISVVLPVIVLVDLWTASVPEASGRTRIRTTAIACSMYGLLGILWLIWRQHVLGQAIAAHVLVAWSTCVLNSPGILLFDLSRTLLPIGLSPHYDCRLTASAGDPRFLAALLALLILGCLAVVLARRNPRLWVGFAWIILPVLPTVNLRWMDQGDFLHDRYMYVSMLGVAILAGSAYASLRRKWPEATLVRPMCAVLIAGMTLASVIQSQYWANDVYLFSRAVKIAPENEWAQLNYGAALSTRGKYAEAAPHFVRSYQLQAGWRAASFAGFAYQQSGNLEQAEHWFNVALQADPALATAWFGLAQIRIEQQRPQDAIDFLNHALAIQPNAEGYHYAMGKALEQSSRFSEALEEYRTELRLHPFQTGAQKAIERLQASSRKSR